MSLRYFNVAGALHDSDTTSYGERHRVETHLIPLALRYRLAAVEDLRTDYPTPDGACVRDYIHVVDLADAHIRALTFGEPGEHHVVNLGSGSGYSVREVVDAASAVTGRPIPVQTAPRRTGDPATLVAANTRAESLLGWVPQSGLTEMVADASRFEPQHRCRWLRVSGSETHARTILAWDVFTVDTVLKRCARISFTHRPAMPSASRGPAVRRTGRSH